LKVRIGSPISHFQIFIVSSNRRNENLVLPNVFIQLYLSKHDTSFILNGKEWGVRRTERERERVRGGVWVRKGCGVGHKLDPLAKYLWGSKEGIIQEFIKMNIKLIPRILSVNFSRRCLLFIQATI
jgi:hypothetical protein